MVTDEEGQVIGTASLMMNEYSKRAGFRIFHSEADDQDCYRVLLQAILSHTEDLERIFAFVPLENHKLAEALSGLGFYVERYSFLLARENHDIPSYTLPVEYTIKDFVANSDEESYCAVRNAGFSKLKGHETPITTKMLKGITAREDYIEGGIEISYHRDKPIGVVRGDNDVYEDTQVMNIGPLALLPEYQGRGLGRVLLRASLTFAREKS